MAKSEMGFFKVIVRPLWALLNEYYVFFLLNNFFKLVKWSPRKYR